ncbi:hypothetical protein FHL15_008448 [Xylaria flabelliformis]|uniref:Rhodopsin domain-containing protein n=1 Tax=Xylaria flabelliformis TaxID=2512241 RepID=A0A553HRV7_9PEZI|nr:hypothetical protein FHL15_008448 [Xylaria flabelliformis]
MYSIQSPDENPAWRDIIFNSVLNVLTIVVVSFRLYSRRVTRAGFGWDDGFILAATLLVNGMLIAAGFLIYVGFGLPVNKVASDDRKKITELDRLFRLLFLLCICFVKLSGLFFYLRVFGTRVLCSKLPDPSSNGNTDPGTDNSLRGIIRLFLRAFRRFAQGLSRRSLYIFMVCVVIAWSIANVIQELAVCPPKAPLCVHQRSTDLAICVFNAVGDLLILLLPLWPVWKLQLSKGTKIGISLVFLLGTVTIIVAFLRFEAIAHTEYGANYNATGMKAVNYAILEPNLAILCMSLPMVKSLILKAVSRCKSKIQGRNEGSWWPRQPFAGKFTQWWTGGLSRVFAKPKEEPASSGNNGNANNLQSSPPDGTHSEFQPPAVPLPARLRDDHRHSGAGTQHRNGDRSLTPRAGGLWRAESHGSSEEELMDLAEFLRGPVTP